MQNNRYLNQIPLKNKGIKKMNEISEDHTDYWIRNHQPKIETDLGKASILRCFSF